MNAGHEFQKLPAHPRALSSRFGIVWAQWNSDITTLLADGAAKYLTGIGIHPSQIQRQAVSGAFELPLGVALMLETGRYDGVIAIGCLIKGETPHFEFIADSVTQRLSELALNTLRPVGYGLLTVLDHHQALARAGGALGNKGEEAAEAVVNLLGLKYSQGL
ncbi:MAG: 6,7-dimethyl-8-ribityllumazine synthase [Bacteroidetes bacterium]|nr:6,7-dimethyl-8-ribityllumazine synthase [Bacteroidota bacterium]